MPTGATIDQKRAIVAATRLPAEDRNWAASIARRESGWDPTLVHKSAAGVWQIVPVLLDHYRATHPEDLVTQADLLDPEVNLRVWHWYWQWLGDRPYLPSRAWRTLAFRVGPGAVREALDVVPAQPWELATTWLVRARQHPALAEKLIASPQIGKYLGDVVTRVAQADRDDASLRSLGLGPAWTITINAVLVPDIAERAWQLWRPVPSSEPRALTDALASADNPMPWPKQDDYVDAAAGWARQVGERRDFVGPHWARELLEAARTDPRAIAARRRLQASLPERIVDAARELPALTTEAVTEAAKEAAAAAEQLATDLERRATDALGWIVVAGLLVGAGILVWRAT